MSTWYNIRFLKYMSANQKTKDESLSISRGKCLHINDTHTSTTLKCKEEIDTFSEIQCCKQYIIYVTILSIQLEDTFHSTRNRLSKEKDMSSKKLHLTQMRNISSPGGLQIKWPMGKQDFSL